MDPLRISYDQLRRQPDTIVDWIISKAGLPARTAALAPEGRMRKMRDGINAEWLRRYRATREACRRAADAGTLLAIGPAGRRWSWAPRADPGPAEFGQPLMIDIVVSNRGWLPWPALGWEDGTLWLTLFGYLEDMQGQRVTAFHGLAVPGRGFMVEIERAVAPGESVTVTLCVPSAFARGRYRLRCDLRQQGIGRSFKHAGTPPDCVLEWDWPAPRKAARALWPETADLLTGWQYLPWLGYFHDDVFPWIQHAEHGWWLIDTAGSNSGHYRIYDAALGWIRSGPADYPEITVETAACRLRFQQQADGERTFTDCATGAAIRVPANLEPQPPP
jgi:hypothetical protein